MITAADIFNRTLKRGAKSPVTDGDIETYCEWCEIDLTLGECATEKVGPNLIYRCADCGDVLLIINRHRDENCPKEWSSENSVERASLGANVDGWFLRSAEDLHVGDIIIPRVPNGALRRYW